jgi:hypothetical protein
MKYLCLIHFAESELDALSPSDYNALVDEAQAYDERLRESGHFLVANALQPVQAATTLRMRNGQLSITDGPFAETKEQLGGRVSVQWVRQRLHQLRRCRRGLSESAPTETRRPRGPAFANGASRPKRPFISSASRFVA